VRVTRTAKRKFQPTIFARRVNGRNKAERVGSLSRRPLRVAGKKSIREADLVGEEETKSQAQQAGSKSQPVGKVRVLFSEEVERRSDAHRNQHHATNCAGAEDQQVYHRPVRVCDRCENEERDCGRTRKPVNDSNNQRTQLLIESDSAKYPVQPSQRSLMAVRMYFGPVSMSMGVDVIAVNMGMGMNDVRLRGNRK